MLKKICVFLAIGLVLMTAACGGNTTAADTSGDSASTASGSEENVLILGTLKLEDTDQAITSDQASELLVLWKAMRVLSSSDTTSQAELDALFQQIKDTMTADQFGRALTVLLYNRFLWNIAGEDANVVQAASDRFYDVRDALVTDCEISRFLD